MPVRRILHRGGNHRDLFPRARLPGVDAIEADLWARGDVFTAHHERPLGWLPFHMRGRWPVRRESEPVLLHEIFEVVHDVAELVIDLRSWFADPAPDLVDKLLPLTEHGHISVTCESWEIADRLRAWMPQLRVVYSVRSELDLRRYLDGRRRGEIDEVPVTVHHELLHSPDEVEVLRRAAGTVETWTVDDIDRAITLVEWGVDGVVSNRVTVLNAI